MTTLRVYSRDSDDVRIISTETIRMEWFKKRGITPEELIAHIKGEFVAAFEEEITKHVMGNGRKN